MRACLDTNILVYAFTNDRRTSRADELLAADPILAVQSFNEFANVARRRLGWSRARISDALAALEVICPAPQPLTFEVHRHAMALVWRHDLAIYDAMIVAAALAADCDTLWSEDMHDGLVVEGRLTIRNPFTTGAPA